MLKRSSIICVLCNLLFKTVLKPPGNGRNTAGARSQAPKSCIFKAFSSLKYNATCRIRNTSFVWSDFLLFVLSAVTNHPMYRAYLFCLNLSLENQYPEMYFIILRIYPLLLVVPNSNCKVQSCRIARFRVTGTEWRIRVSAVEKFVDRFENVTWQDDIDPTGTNDVKQRKMFARLFATNVVRPSDPVGVPGPPGTCVTHIGEFTRAAVSGRA